MTARNAEALERRRTRERERYRAAHPGSRHNSSREERAQLGPALPLNGVTETRAAQARTARILRAAQEGVTVEALCERFDASPSAILKVLSRGRVPAPDASLPLGSPA